MKRALECLLFVLFAGFGIMKLAGHPEEGTVLGQPWAYYSIAAAELAIACMMANARTRMSGAIGALAFSVLGMGLSLWVDTPCGCGGTLVTLTESQKLILLSATGMAATLWIRLFRAA